MIERVAKAIGSIALGNFINRSDFNKAQARVAIEAMREPTEEMIMAAGLSPTIEDWKENLKCNYQIMIDTALNEKT